MLLSPEGPQEPLSLRLGLQEVSVLEEARLGDSNPPPACVTRHEEPRALYLRLMT